MDTIFLKLFNMSVAAGWLIMAVIVLRLILKKAPKWLTCTLWAMVAIRLICPFSLESSFSLIPSAETISPDVVRYAEEPVIESGIPYINNMGNPIISEFFSPDPGASVNPLHALMYIAGIVWAIGVVCMLGYAVISFCRIRRKLREAVPLRDNVWICDAVKSPFILGVIRPQVYLSSSINEEQGKYVLAHEQAHLKRMDHWWKLLGYLLLAVYWFHPLVWAAYILLCRDIELACDEKTIKYMDMKEKKAYSEALVACSIQKKMVLVSPLAFGEVGVKERVKTVLHYKKPAFWIIMAAVAVCAVVAVCFLTNPERDVFDIKIVIPAGCEGGFYYSEEEISPNGSRVILSSGEGIGDTEVVLYPTEMKSENNYRSTYMTPGLSVKMDAEKGAWFRVGVNMSNPSSEDKIVYVQVKGVTVRIADLAVRGGTNFDTEGEGEGRTPGAEGEGEGKNLGAEGEGEGRTLGAEGEGEGKKPGTEGEREGTVPESDKELREGIYDDETVYIGQDTITFVGVIVDNTVDTANPGILVEPMGDEIFYEHIWFRLPAEEADWGKQINSIVAITCNPMFLETDPPIGDLISIDRVGSSPLQSADDADIMDVVLSNLLDIICSDPKTSSNPQDYIDAHASEYGELVDYGEDTLRYCFGRFRDGHETGLEGHVMALACEEILESEDKIPVNAGAAETGQFWYETLLAHASNLIEPYLK